MRRLAVWASVALYRLLIRLRYPTWLRDRFGDEMVELFRDLLVADVEAGMGSALWTSWARILKDASTSLPPAVAGSPGQAARGDIAHRLQNRGREEWGEGDGW